MLAFKPIFVVGKYCKYKRGVLGMNGHCELLYIMSGWIATKMIRSRYHPSPPDLHRHHVQYKLPHFMRNLYFFTEKNINSQLHIIFIMYITIISKYFTNTWVLKKVWNECRCSKPSKIGNLIKSRLGAPLHYTVA